RRSYGISSPQSLRQSGFPVYDQRVGRAQIPLRSARGEYRHQHRRGRAHGLFSLQRLERKLFWHPSRPGTRRRGILHRIQNRRRALVAPGNPQVLIMLTKPLHLDVHEQIECAQTLASRLYTDPAILEIEKSRIFQRTWRLVGTLTQSCGEVNGVKRTISDPESFFTADVSGEPIIVVRGKDGALRAFSNVCRHTSARLLSRRKVSNSRVCNLPSAAITSSIAIGKFTSTTISRAITFPSRIPA